MPNMILLFPEMLVCDKKKHTLALRTVCECVTVTHMHAREAKSELIGGGGGSGGALLAPVLMYTCTLVYLYILRAPK